MEQANCRYANVFAKLKKFWWKDLEQSSLEGNEKLNKIFGMFFFQQKFLLWKEKNIFYC